MRRFEFRLEPVLKCRVIKEEQKVQALAYAQREEESREALLKAVSDEYAQSMDGEGTTIWELQQWAFYRDLLREQVHTKAAELDVAAEQVTNCRAELMDARQERLTMEKVKERRYANFLEEEACKERKQYDEISQLVFQNKAINGLPEKGGE
ncbi:MAG: flagellar export protein FliJ [Bacillota bacterium]